jgi:hypothetical protein
MFLYVNQKKYDVESQNGEVRGGDTLEETNEREDHLLPGPRVHAMARALLLSICCRCVAHAPEDLAIATKDQSRYPPPFDVCAE